MKLRAILYINDLRTGYKINCAALFIYTYSFLRLHIVPLYIGIYIRAIIRIYFFWVWFLFNILVLKI